MPYKYIILIFLAIISFFGITSDAFAQDVKEQRVKIKKLEKEILFIDRQLASNRVKQKTNIAELNLLNRKIINQEDIIESIGQTIIEYSSQIIIKEKEIVKIEAELKKLMLHFRKLVKESYKIRDANIWFIYILASESINEGFRRWKYLQNLSGSLKNETEKINAKQSQLETEKNNLINLRFNASKSKNQKDKEFITLKKAKKQSQRIVRQLSSKEKVFREQIIRKKREGERLNREVERILAEAIKKEKGKAVKDKIDYKLSNEFSANKGRLPWPVTQGVVVDKFGQHDHPVFKNVKLPYNNGINISAEINSAANVIFNGTVKQILVVPGYNQCVLIQHGEYFTFYCKLKEVYVKPGDKMTAGSTIGIIDESDNNALLHFQLWKGISKQNPELWLR